MPVWESVKVGLEPRSHAGEGGLRLVSDVTLEKKDGSGPAERRLTAGKPPITV